MNKFTFKQGNENDLDLIQPLWKKLNQLHFHLSPHFKSRFQHMNWDKRKQKLLEKSSAIKFEYIENQENNTIIGYCISTIDKDDHKVGEIDSIYIDEGYRNTGLGKQLLKFYQQFDFYPLHIVLQRREKE